MPDAPATPPPILSPLCALATVMVRLFALYLGYLALSDLFSALAGFHTWREARPNLIMFAAIGVSAYWLWQASALLARQITRGQEAALPEARFTLIELYTFGFIFMGLYFAVDAVGPTLAWAYHATELASTTAPLTLQQKAIFYNLFRYLVALLLGLALLFNARRFAAKLLKHQRE